MGIQKKREKKKKDSTKPAWCIEPVHRKSCLNFKPTLGVNYKQYPSQLIYDLQAYTAPSPQPGTVCRTESSVIAHAPARREILSLKYSTLHHFSGPRTPRSPVVHTINRAG